MNFFYNIVSYSGEWSKKKTYFVDHSISDGKKKTILSTINENAQKQPRGEMSAFFFGELADEKNWVR